MTFLVDQEHGRLRAALFAFFIIVWILVYFILDRLLRNSGLNLLAILIGLVSGFAATAVAERVLKGRWTSGRTLVVEDTGVQLKQQGEVQTAIATERAVELLLWRFIVRRRSRVPKGWSVVACALREGDSLLSVYTLMSPQQVGALPQLERFRVLESDKPKGRRNKERLENLRVGELRDAGEQRRLRDAEQDRWMYGVEMTPSDFSTYTARIFTLSPEWNTI